MSPPLPLALPRCSTTVRAPAAQHASKAATKVPSHCPKRADQIALKVLHEDDGRILGGHPRPLLHNLLELILHEQHAEPEDQDFKSCDELSSCLTLLYDACGTTLRVRVSGLGVGLGSGLGLGLGLGLK